MIKTINYSSQLEKELKNKLTREIKRNIHPSINEWIRNLLVCQTDKYLIRIDETEKGLRYSSWKTGKQISDPPDLVIFNGEFGFHGTQGGVYYTFKQGKWTYLLDQWDLCGDQLENCGLSLIVKDEEKEILKLACTKIK